MTMDGYDPTVILPRVYSKKGGKFAEKARLQRLTPTYKAWRLTYESTPEFKAKIRVREQARNGDPVWTEKRREYARRTRERNKIKYLVRSAIHRSKQNGLECHEKYLKTVVAVQRPAHCPCCNVVLDYRMSRNGAMPKVDGPSLDRIDCSKGYIEGNIEIICWRCNAIKRDATLQELDRIVAYMRTKLP